MSEDWNTKYGPRRVRRDPPTLDEAIFAAVGITDDQEAQAEIAASLMGLPLEAVQAEVRKAGAHRRACLDDARHRGRTGRAAFGRGRAPGGQEVRQRQANRDLTRRASSARTEIRCLAAASGSGRAPPAVHSQQQLPIGAVETGGRAHGFDPDLERNFAGSGRILCFRSMLPVDSPCRKARCAPNLVASARIASFSPRW